MYIILMQTRIQLGQVQQNPLYKQGEHKTQKVENLSDVMFT